MSELSVAIPTVEDYAGNPALRHRLTPDWLVASPSAPLGYVRQMGTTTDHARNLFIHTVSNADVEVAHQLWGDSIPQQTIVIAGATGLVGRQLCAILMGLGLRVVALTREIPDIARTETNGVFKLVDPSAPLMAEWNPSRGEVSQDLIDEADAVINLAGATIAGRFTEKHREAIMSSRIQATTTLVDAITRARKRNQGPKVLVNASATGYYGYDGDDTLLDESAPSGKGFLAAVCRAWEDAARRVKDSGARLGIVRTGLAMSARGGLLAAQLPLFAAGMGGPVGSGNQWLPWIALDDLVYIYMKYLADETMPEVVNATSQFPVQQRDFAATLAAVMHRPSKVTTPRFAVEMALGKQAAQELVFASARAIPQALRDHGHIIRFPRLGQVLRHTLG